MAVWIYAYGRNALGNYTEEANYFEVINRIEIDALAILDSLKEIRHNQGSIREHYENNRENIDLFYNAMSDEEYNSYLSSMHLPFIERDKLIDYFIKEGEEQENKEKLGFENAYTLAKKGILHGNWQIDKQEEKFTVISYYLEITDSERHCISIILQNDMVRISGAFRIFSVYSCFQHGISEHSRNYYHNLFKAILEKFNSDFILYTHEWADSIADDEPDPTVKMIFDYFNEGMSSSSIHNMEGFYFEKL